MTYDPAPVLAQARLALLERDEAATTKAVAHVLHVDPRTVHRWRAGKRLGPIQADRLAVRLQLHPLNLWPHYHESRTAL